MKILENQGYLIGNVYLCVCVWRVEVGKSEIKDVLKILDNEIVCIFLLGDKDRKNWQERVAC